MGKTAIGWCTHSLNFIKWWCTKHSEGCKNCYMMALAERYPQHAADSAVWRAKAELELKSLPPGAEAFVGDMYDLFHEQMPLEFIDRHFEQMATRPDVVFLLLTKRMERALEIAGRYTWTPNIYMGCSVENRKRAFRIDLLRQHPAARKFLSIEPLLESLGEQDFSGINQVITGGESGASRRPFDPAWAALIRDQCQRDGATFYHKQGGNRFPGVDRLIDNRTHDDLHWRTEQAVLF